MSLSIADVGGSTRTVARSTGSLLEARDVCFAYGAEPVVDHVDISVDAGEFVALVGPNGSGKSTLVRVLLGLLPAQHGRVRRFGEQRRPGHDRLPVGYVPQRLHVAPDLPATVEEVVAAGRVARQGWWRRPRAVDRAAVDDALEAIALTPLRRHPLRELSGGQQQRVLIAKALVAEPALLVLDEPVAGVDAASQSRFRDALVHLVRGRGIGVLLVSHELDAVAADLDRVVVLKRRVLFDGPANELAAQGVSLGVHAADLPRWLEDLG